MKIYRMKYFRHEIFAIYSIFRVHSVEIPYSQKFEMDKIFATPGYPCITEISGVLYLANVIKIAISEVFTG